MTLYRYRAIAANGEVVEGELEAADKPRAIDRIRAMGHMPVTAEAADTRRPAGWLKRDLLSRRRLGLKDMTLLFGELATLLRAGMPLARSLEVLIDIGENPRIVKLLQDLLARVRDGAALAEAMEETGGVFPRMHISMVRAGEAGGNLESILERLGDYMARAQALRESVTTALIYPLILLLLAGVTVILLVTFVIPEFQPLFDQAGQELPVATQIVVAVGDAVRSYWWAMSLAGLIVWLLSRRDYASAAGRVRWHAMFLRLPLYGELVSKVEVARLCRTLGALLGSGVALLTALEIVRETLENIVLANAVGEVAEAARQGQGLSGPLAAQGLFPVMAVQLVRVGEETGELEAMLTKVADIYDEEVRKTVERMLRLLVPVVTIGLGLLIAGIISSILVAILGINQLVV